MNLAEKLKHLREIEGELRGLNRPMTQVEVVKAMQEELQDSISQGYLSQLESNKRLHLTASSRDLLSRFFKVHPGYLVSDPADFSTDLISEMEHDADPLTTWLTTSAEEWRRDPIVNDLFQRLADTKDPHRYLELFRDLMNFPVNELETIVNAIVHYRDSEEIEQDAYIGTDQL
jgi:transcriptional regulator with XRE-family HTH domain